VIATSNLAIAKAADASNVAYAALPKSGGTLSGALTGTSASFSTLGGSAISDSVTSTSNNVAASSAAVKNAYDSAIAANTAATNASNIAGSASNVANAALPKAGGALSGALTGTSASFNTLNTGSIMMGTNTTSPQISDALMAASYPFFNTQKSGHGALCLAAGDQKIMFLNSNDSIMDTCIGSSAVNSLRIHPGKITGSNFETTANFRGITIDVGDSLDSRSSNSRIGRGLYLNTARKGFVETGSNLIVNGNIESLDDLRVYNEITYSTSSTSYSNYLATNNTYPSCVGKLQIKGGNNAASLFIAPGGVNTQSNSDVVWICALRGSNATTPVNYDIHMRNSNYCLGDYASNCASINMRGMNVDIHAMNGDTTITANGTLEMSGSKLVVNCPIESYSSNDGTLFPLLNMGKNASSVIYNTISLGNTLVTNGAANIRFSDMRYNTLNDTYHNSNYLGIGFWANDDILTVCANDRVGINTNAPDSALEVQGQLSLRYDSGWNTGGIRFQDTVGNKDAAVIQGANGRLYFRAPGGANGSNGMEWVNNTGNTTLMRLLEDGNFGVGTANPTAKLHVNGDSIFSGSVACATYETTGANMIFMLDSDSNTANATGFIWRANNDTTNLMSLSETGNLFVNTLYPNVTASAGELGTTTRRWSNIYGVDGSFSGSVACATYETTGANMVFMLDSDSNTGNATGFIWRANGNTSNLMSLSETGNFWVDGTIEGSALTGGCISSSVLSASSNVAASSAAVKAAYERAGAATNIDASNITSGILLVTRGGTGVTATTGTGSNVLSISPTLTGTTIVSNLSISGTITGNGISDSVSSTSNNIIASSYAVKTAYDRASTAISTANSASSTANSASSTANSASSTASSAQTTANNALPKSGGTLTGRLDVNFAYNAGHPIGFVNTSTNSTQGMVLYISGGQNNTGAKVLTVDRLNNFQIFNVYASGDAKAMGAVTGGGADYAEYFEWDDSNLNNEDRAGESVVFVQNTCKIRIANPDDPPENIIGVVSCSPAMIGNEEWSHWKGMFLKDDYKRDIYGDVEYATWVDSNGETISIRKDMNKTTTIPDYATTEIRNDVLLNPNYNSNTSYIPRSQRIEWCLIGLMGVLRVNSSSSKNPKWKFITTISNTVEEWLL
jgi:hypothetical protein